MRVLHRSAPVCASLVFALLFALVLTGCRGKLVTTADLHAPGSAEARFRSTGAPVTFWADTDGKWTGGEHSHMSIHYEIDVLLDGAPAGHVSCDTSDASSSVCGTSITVNDTHRADCELKLHCGLTGLAPGDVVLRVTGRTGASVIEVTNMSLNVRAGKP